MIDASSLGLRRTLGPTARLVFEELLLCSTRDGDACVAVVSVRSLDHYLGRASDLDDEPLQRTVKRPATGGSGFPM